MAPTLVHIDGFELQLFSVTTFASGTGTAMYTGAVNAAVETTIIRNGSGSLKVSPTASAAGDVFRTAAASKLLIVESFYVRFDAFPATNVNVVSLTGSSSQNPAMVYQVSSGKLGIKFGVAGTVSPFGPVLVAGQWYLADWVVDMSANPNTQKGRVNGDLGTEASNSQGQAASTGIVSIILGAGGVIGPAADIYYDDWIYSHTLADYPLGEHKVELLKPTSDGTHNAGTNVVEDQAGTDIGAATAFGLIDEVPPENTDYVKQSAAGSGNYAEVVFASPSATAWGATYWCAIEGAAASASDLLLRVVNSGGSTLLDQGGAAAVSGTTRRYSVGFLAGDCTGNKGRVGFATDVSPVPRALTFIAQAVVPTGSETFSGVGIPIS